ncbi:MAG TPA: hypothetical protein ENJ28_04930 [Gammaproteobacteria bacterium]|nr:hypothetical protein [Gammaproteobacteria bacterium]
MPGFLNMQQNGNQNPDNNNNNANNNSNDPNNTNQNNNDNNNNNQNNNQNNNSDNNTSIWDNKPNPNDDGQQNNQQQNNQQQDNRTPAEIFNEHVASLDLTSGIDLTQMQEDMQNGNTDSLNKAFDQVAANTYKATLQQVNTLMDNKISTAIEKAVSESTSVMNETTAVKEMQQALPFTTGRDIAPVAEAALKQLMSNGASVQDAVKQVADFFQSTANAVSGGNNQNDVTSGGFNPNTSINNNSSNNNNNSPSDDWMGFLTNKS